MKTLDRNLMVDSWRYLAEGLQFFCFADGDRVLKVHKSGADSMAQARAWGHELSDFYYIGDPLWTSNPKAMADRYASDGRAAVSACFERIPDLTCLLEVIETLPQGILPERPELAGRFAYIQRRTVILQDVLAGLDDNEALIPLERLLTTVETVWSRGMTDVAFNFMNGYGLLEGERLIAFDCGEIVPADAQLIQNYRRDPLILKSYSFSELKLTRPALAMAFAAMTRKRWDCDD
ncbi:MAG: hypothetical protein U9Q07_14220 [Planctomycetota bacterium]|nr:hypothetical protein [Planctomycetota bacterium]